MGERFADGRIDLVDHQRDGLAELAQQLCKLAIRSSDFGASINEEDDVRGFLQRDTGLPEDLAWNEVFVVGDDSAGVDQFEVAAAELALSANAIARDPRLIAHNGAAGFRYGVEKCRFSDIRSAYDDNHRQTLLGVHQFFMVASAMRYYPLFLDLHGRHVLVVGAGPVALRKCRALVDAGAKVTVVSPQALPEFDDLGVTLIHREFRPYDVRAQTLVFAATDQREVNAEVKRCADAQAIPVNVADSPEECTFVVPARVERGNLQIAISTSAEDPRLAKKLRIQLEALLDQAANDQAAKGEL